MLSEDFFVGNRNKLLQQLKDDALVIITAQALLQRSGDTTFPFRQDSNFFYLTGLDEPDLILVMQGDEEFIILPKRTEVETIFGGSINRDEIAKKSGIKIIYESQEGWRQYKKMQQNRKIIYTLNKAPSKVSGIDSFFTNPARSSLLQKIKRINSNTTVKDIRPTVSAMRQIKQPEEIEVLKQAVAITKQGFDSTYALLQNGTTEYEIEAELHKIFTANRARHGYQPIVAGGSRACILHYIKNNQQITKNELCLLDAGAEVANYSADVTRTYGATVSARQNEVISAVKRIQDYALGIIKPGLSWKEYAQSVENKVGEELLKLRLINEITTKKVRRYFPHGISHSLGLDVHDVCDYKTLQKNMVITVEPGIYIPEEEIGVRIEDDILITKDGTINLSADIAYN